MTPTRTRKVEGFALLEVLVSVLIFSLGILSLVSLQAASTKLTTDARYRAEAALLVNQVLGNMWVSDRTVGTLQSNFNTGNGAGYTNWFSSVSSTLPGVVANSATEPTIAVDGSGIVTVTVFWKAPSDNCLGGPALPHHRRADSLTGP